MWVYLQDERRHRTYDRVIITANNFCEQSRCLRVNQIFVIKSGRDI